MTKSLSPEVKKKLDALLQVEESRVSPLQAIKQAPGLPSPAAMLRLATKLEQIEDTGILSLDLAWLNNNYQRSLTRYARRCSADKLRRFLQRGADAFSLPRGPAPVCQRVTFPGYPRRRPIKQTDRQSGL